MTHSGPERANRCHFDPGLRIVVERLAHGDADGEHDEDEDGGEQPAGHAR